MICITSFHKEHWNMYANKFIQTWIEYWPDNSILYSYHQEFFIDNSRIVNVDLNKVDSFKKFKDTTENIIKTITDTKEKNRYLKGLRWAHKVYAICDLLDKTDEPIIWLDADTYSKKSIPLNYDSLLLKGKDLAVHVEIQNNMTHWETGLFVIGGSADNRITLKNNIMSLYDSGDIWKQKKTWDGHMWPECCKHMHINDLNKDIRSARKGYFGNKNVRPYMVHLAGDNKFTNTVNKRSGRSNF
jgi:hypothetical protein